MDFSKKRLTIAEAKEMDLVSYLSELGHEPSKIRGNSYWYSSPLREEKTPSFTVNRNRNVWYDFGLGKGGSIIDFGVQYYSKSIPEVLQLLTDRSGSQVVPIASAKPGVAEKETKLKITQVGPIHSPSLLGYLEGRKIPLSLAQQFCQEVRFESAGKNFYGIGFQNDAGGYEIRNPYFKGSSSPKDITTIDTGAKSVAIFEGFFDFLSYQALQKQGAAIPSDYLILNSLSFFEKSLPGLDKYQQVDLYLDNNPPGRKFSAQAVSLGEKFNDRSGMYQGHDDLNDFLLTRQPDQKKSIRKGLRPH